MPPFLVILPWLLYTANAECRGIPSTLELDWGSVSEESDRNDASVTMRRNATGDIMATSLGRATCEASDSEEIERYLEKCLYCLEDQVAYTLQLVDRYGDGWKEGKFLLYVDGVLIMEGSQGRGDKECPYDETRDAPCSVSSFRYFVATNRPTLSPTEEHEKITVEIDWSEGKYPDDRLTAAVALSRWSSPASQLLTPSTVYDSIRGHERNSTAAWLEFENDDSLVVAGDYEIDSGTYSLELREKSGLLSGWNGGLARVSLRGQELTRATIDSGSYSAVSNFTVDLASSTPTPSLAPLANIWLVVDWTAESKVAGASVQVFCILGPPYVNGFRNDSDLLLPGQYLRPVRGDNATSLEEVIPEPSRREEHSLSARLDDVLVLRITCWPQEPWNGGFVQLLDSSRKLISYTDGTGCNHESGYKLDIKVPLTPIFESSPSTAPSANTYAARTYHFKKVRNRLFVGKAQLALTLAVAFTGSVALLALCIATFVLVRYMRPASSGFTRSGRPVSNPMMNQDDPLDDARLVDFEDEREYESSEPYRDHPSLVHSEFELPGRSHSSREPRRASPRPVTLVNLSPASPVARAPSRSYETPLRPISADRARDSQRSQPSLRDDASPFSR